MCSLNRLSGLALVLLTSPSLATGTMYTYKDDGGTTTFTNEWESIPERHRDRAVPLNAKSASPSAPRSSGSTVRVLSVSAEYRMGDQDTRTEAIRAAVDYAKRQALEQVATYLESVTEVTQADITRDELRTYTTGMVTVLSQQISTRLEGQTVVIHAALLVQVHSTGVVQAISPGLAATTMYTYKDDTGTSTFTTDWDSIPTRYRNRAVLLDLSGIVHSP